MAPHIRVAIAQLRVNSATIDDEFVAFVDDRPSFNALQNHRRLRPEIRFVAFGLIELNGRNLQHRKLSEGRRLLERLSPMDSRASLV